MLKLYLSWRYYVHVYPLAPSSDFILPPWNLFSPQLNSEIPVAGSINILRFYSSSRSKPTMPRLVLKALSIMHRYDTLTRKPFFQRRVPGQSRCARETAQIQRLPKGRSALGGNLPASANRLPYLWHSALGSLSLLLVWILFSCWRPSITSAPNVAKAGVHLNSAAGCTGFFHGGCRNCVAEGRRLECSVRDGDSKRHH